MPDRSGRKPGGVVDAKGRCWRCMEQVYDAAAIERGWKWRVARPDCPCLMDDERLRAAVCAAVQMNIHGKRIDRQDLSIALGEMAFRTDTLNVRPPGWEETMRVGCWIRDRLPAVGDNSGRRRRSLRGRTKERA